MVTEKELNSQEQEKQKGFKSPTLLMRRDSSILIGRQNILGKKSAVSSPDTIPNKSPQEVAQNDPIERAIKGLIKVSLKNNNLVCPKCGKEYHSPIVIKTIREQAISNFAEKIKGEIELCLKDTNKKKELGMPQGYDWRGEALGYKTCLNIIKNKLVEEQSSGETK